MNANKFATGQILEKPVEVVKGQILAGWAQKSPEPCLVPYPPSLPWPQIKREVHEPPFHALHLQSTGRRGLMRVSACVFVKEN